MGPEWELRRLSGSPSSSKKMSIGVHMTCSSYCNKNITTCLNKACNQASSSTVN